MDFYMHQHQAVQRDLNNLDIKPSLTKAMVQQQQQGGQR
jgi:hypothetical protein